MPALLIETSTEQGIVALAEKEADSHESRLLFSEVLPFGYQHSKMLLPTIQRGLEETGLQLRQLDYLVVGIGPGSYTGIRVGAVVAKSFSYVCQLPIVSLSTLHAFIPSEDGMFAAIIDAKIGGVYLVKGKRKGKKMEYLSMPELSSMDLLQDKLSDVDLLVTPNAKQLRRRFEENFGKRMWEWEEVPPSVSHMACLGQKLYEQKKYSLDTRLELLYLRKTQAEIEKEQKDS